MSSKAGALPRGFTRKYRLGRTLGQGNYAIVKEVVDIASGEPRAVKIIDKVRFLARLARPGRPAAADTRRPAPPPRSPVPDPAEH